MHGPSEDHTERLALEVQVGRDPIQGRIETAGGQHPFYGWMELIRSIEAVARTPDDSD